MALIPPLLELVSFARMERWLRVASRLTRGDAPDDIAVAAWVDAWLLRLPAPWAHTCLRRASVLYYLLRSADQTVDLCIGVRRDERGELLAHAWLLADGQVYLERGRSSEQVAEFTRIAQFP